MTGETQEAAAFAALETGGGLRLWAADAGLAAAVQELLDGHCAVELAAEIPEAAETDGPVLLLCPAPGEALSRALQAGSAPQEALAAWRQQAGRILALQRQRRRQVRIVEAGVLRRAPGRFLAFCGMASGAAAEAEAQLAAAAGTAPGGVLQALAQNCLQADPDLRRLAGELAAAAEALDGAGAEAVAPEAVLQAYLEEQDLLQEADLLRARRGSMYEQMESLYSGKQQLEQRLLQMRSALDGCQQLEARVAALQERLAAKDWALQAAGGELAALQQAVALQAQRAESLRARMQQLEASRSYRLTAPLRQLRGGLQGGGS